MNMLYTCLIVYTYLNRLASSLKVRLNNGAIDWKLQYNATQHSLLEEAQDANNLTLSFNVIDGPGGGD